MENKGKTSQEPKLEPYVDLGKMIFPSLPSMTDNAKTLRENVAKSLGKEGLARYALHFCDGPNRPMAFVFRIHL